MFCIKNVLVFCFLLTKKRQYFQKEWVGPEKDRFFSFFFCFFFGWFFQSFVFKFGLLSSISSSSLSFGPIFLLFFHGHSATSSSPPCPLSFSSPSSSSSRGTRWLQTKGNSSPMASSPPSSCYDCSCSSYSTSSSPVKSPDISTTPVNLYGLRDSQRIGIPGVPVPAQGAA